MVEQVTRLHISFLKNHSGLNSSYILKQVNFFQDELPIHDKETYNVIYLAAEYGLKVENVDVFHGDDFSLYHYKYNFIFLKLFCNLNWFLGKKLYE